MSLSILHHSTTNSPFRFSKLLPLMAMAAFLFCASAASAATATGFLSSDSSDRLSTVPHDPAMQEAVKDSMLDLVVVNHEGWRETVPSFARLKIYEMTGRKSIHGQAPEYTILSMIYQNQEWITAKIFPIEHPALLEMLQVDGKWVSWQDVVANPNLEKLLAEVNKITPLRTELQELTNLMNAIEQARNLGTEMRVLSMFENQGVDPAAIRDALMDESKYAEIFNRRKELMAELDKEKPFVKAGEKLLSRVQLLTDLPNQFLVVPDTESAETRWIRPVALNGSSRLVDAGRSFDLKLREAFATASPDLIAPATAQFLDLVERSRYYPTETFRKAQNFYVQKNPWRLASATYLVTAALFGLWFFFRRRSFYWSGVALLSVGFLLHTTAVVIRGYLTGHIPVSNMFESITFCSWAIMLIAVGVELWNRKGLVGVSAAILGFLFLAAAGLMPLHETRIHPLRAVLNSYWLNIHVTMMLISYAAFAISAMFAGGYLIKAALGRESLLGGKPLMSLAQTEEFAYRLVQLGWPILTLGIALGAVWADTAWGRFWGWDPKETWAFITWVGYTVYLHMRMVMGWRGKWSAAACVLGFVLVLITWLGVSYIPLFAGGLHSYASPNTF